MSLGSRKRGARLRQIGPVSLRSTLTGWVPETVRSLRMQQKYHSFPGIEHRFLGRAASSFYHSNWEEKNNSEEELQIKDYSFKRENVHKEIFFLFADLQH